MSADNDFAIHIEPSLADAMPIEEAIAQVCEELKLPLLGGASGQGWSLYSTAQRCPHLFKRQHVEGAGGELRVPAEPLQIGTLYHFLQALYYAPGLGPAVYQREGLISAELYAKRRGRKPKTIEIPPEAADWALAKLREMAQPLEAELRASIEGGKPPYKPSANVVAVAEGCFDAHTAYYGNGNEDMIPLAIEWHATNEALEYTCRYDMIARLGPNDPLGLPEGSIVIMERKTAGWLSEMTREGWHLDGEILGEILNWEPSGCEQLFGPLAAVVIDVVTKKADKPEYLRVVVPASAPPVNSHGRWIRWMQSQIRLWESTGVYPQFFTQCFDRWGKCGEWDNCARGCK